MINSILILIIIVMQCHIAWQHALQVNYMILQVLNSLNYLNPCRFSNKKNLDMSHVHVANLIRSHTTQVIHSLFSHFSLRLSSRGQSEALSVSGTRAE